MIRKGITLIEFIAAMLAVSILVAVEALSSIQIDKTAAVKKGPITPAKVSAAIVTLQDGHDYVKNSLYNEFGYNYIYTHAGGCMKCEEYRKLQLPAEVGK